MTIVYTNVGRDKGCKAVDVSMEQEMKMGNTEEFLEEYIANEAREFLMSDDITAMAYKKNKYNIYAGLRPVGKAEII